MVYKFKRTYIGGTVSDVFFWGGGGGGGVMFGARFALEYLWTLLLV